ncbi:hypothetical protein ExPUPEC79_02688 [Escherichia coli]|nr:hypothetical protein ExPCM16_01770 [Escherichia coli]GDP10961.1 hypothetical protein BvCmsOUNP023_00389 [Escherichia coli]GDU93096.1 hypothetical protein ExPUPEC79_02688 [Escherichia coli]
MTDTGIKRAAFRCLFIALLQEVVGIVVGFAVSGVIAPGGVMLACGHFRRGFTVVVVPRGDTFFHHAVRGVQPPYGFRFTIKQPRRMAKRQRQPALVAALVVVKFDNFDFQPGVGGKAEPDTHL